MSTDVTRYPVTLDDAEWRAAADAGGVPVLRQAGTESAVHRRVHRHQDQGVYRCRACGAELFRSDTKFDSHCGWPSFFAPLARGPRSSTSRTVDAA